VLIFLFLILILSPRPSGGAPRYWTSLWPFVLIIMLGALESLDATWSVGRNWRRKLGVAVGVVLSAAALGALLYDHSQRQPQDDPVWDAFVRICQTAGDITPQDAVILSHNQTAARFISKRYAQFTEADCLRLAGKQGEWREVYVIVPSPAAVAAIGRTTPFDALAWRVSEIANNEYYSICRLLPK
jgi:hypothetical protein